MLIGSNGIHQWKQTESDGEGVQERHGRIVGKEKETSGDRSSHGQLANRRSPIKQPLN